jgi:S1-C subfamily serine protease
VGEEVELKIWRDGETETVRVTLEGVESGGGDNEEGEEE